MNLIYATKKPIGITAMKYDGGLKSSQAIYRWMGIGYPEAGGLFLLVKTLEGELRVSVGDYVIKGIKGEFEPCDADIFEESYDIQGEGVVPEPKKSTKVRAIYRDGVPAAEAIEPIKDTNLTLGPRDKDRCKHNWHHVNRQWGNGLYKNTFVCDECGKEKTLKYNI